MINPFHQRIARSPFVIAAMASAFCAITPDSAVAADKTSNLKPVSATRAFANCPVTSAPSLFPAPRITSSLILNGSPSALDRIRLSQQVPASSNPQDRPASFVVSAINKPLEPASGLSTTLSLREWTDESADCSTTWKPQPSDLMQRAARQSLLTPEMAYDPEAELGTKAVPIRRTRYDARWNRVRRAPPAALMRTQLRSSGAAAAGNDGELFSRINSWVNREITYQNDDANYGQTDYWATAEQTLARGGGDCEDIAILKMHILRAAGIPADRIKLVLLRDLAGNADHAFLLVKTGDGRVVLDSTTDRIYDGSASNYVQPVLSFSENRRWVHVYPTRPIGEAVLASVTTPALPPLTLAMAVQRSVNAVPLTFKTGFKR